MLLDIESVEEKVLALYPESKPLFERIKSLKKSHHCLVQEKPKCIILSDNYEHPHSRILNFGLEQNLPYVWVTSRNCVIGYSNTFIGEDLERPYQGKPLFEALADIYEEWFKKPVPSKHPVPLLDLSQVIRLSNKYPSNQLIYQIPPHKDY